MKKFILALILGLSILSGNAAIISTTVTNANTNSVISGSIRLQQLIVNNTSTNLLTLRLFDAPSTNLTFTNAAYTVLATIGPTNIVTTYTNIFGVVESWTNRMIYTITNSVAASTNNFATIITLQVPASSSATYTPVGIVTVNRGVLVTNNQAFNMTLDYLNITP